MHRASSPESNSTNSAKPAKPSSTKLGLLLLG